MKNLLLMVFLFSFLSFGQEPVSKEFYKRKLNISGIITANDETISMDIFSHSFGSDSLNNWKFLGNETVTDDYKVYVIVGHIYLLHFTTSDGESKRLMVGASKEGDINVNIDFINEKKEFIFIYEDIETEEFVIEFLKNERKLK